MWYAKKTAASELDEMAKRLERLAKKRRRMNEKFGNGWADVAWGLEEAIALIERRAKKLRA